MTDFPVLPDMTGFIQVFHQCTEGAIADVFAEQGRHIHPMAPDPLSPMMFHMFARSFPAEVNHA